MKDLVFYREIFRATGEEIGKVKRVAFVGYLLKLEGVDVFYHVSHITFHPVDLNAVLERLGFDYFRENLLRIKLGEIKPRPMFRGPELTRILMKVKGFQFEIILPKKLEPNEKEWIKAIINAGFSLHKYYKERMEEYAMYTAKFMEGIDEPVAFVDFNASKIFMSRKFADMVKKIEGKEKIRMKDTFFQDVVEELYLLKDVKQKTIKWNGKKVKIKGKAVFWKRKVAGAVLKLEVV